MAKWKPSGKKRRSQRRTGASATAVRRDERGLVHLVLRSEPGAERAQVALKEPLFRFGWQNRLAAGVADAANRTLQAGVDRSTVATVARDAMDATSQLIDGLMQRSEAQRVACRAGCDHCCYQSVGVTPAEALAIVDYLRATRSSAELADLVHALAAARERNQGLDSKQRFSPEYPCGFLRDGQCTIYPVRPLACRGMNSLDAEECRRMLYDPRERSEYLERGVGGHSFLEPIQAFHAVSAGLQLGLSELHQLDMRPLDLIAAVHELLSGSASLLEDWLEGKPAFSSARGGDSSENPEVQRISGARRPDKPDVPTP